MRNRALFAGTMTLVLAALLLWWVLSRASSSPPGASPVQATQVDEPSESSGSASGAPTGVPPQGEELSPTVAVDREAIESTAWSNLSIICVRDDPLDLPLYWPETLVDSPLYGELVQSRADGRSSDTLSVLAIDNQLTLDTLPDDAPLDHVYAAATVEFLEMATAEDDCQRAVRQDPNVEPNSDDMTAQYLGCAVAEGRARLVEVLDNIAEHTEDTSLSDAAQLLALQTIDSNLAGIGEDPSDQMDRSVALMLQAEDPAVVAYAIAANPTFDVMRHEDWPEMERIALRHPRAAARWLSYVPRQYLWNGEPERAAPWLAMARECHRVRCNPPDDPGMCDRASAIVDRFAGPGGE